MSKFFTEGNPSDDEEKKELEEIEEEETKQPKVTRFNYYESSSEEEEKRTIKTEKDKRFSALREIIMKIKEKIKINDFVSIYNEFEELNKNLEKSKKIIEKEGTPLFYIRICFMLENLVSNFTNEEKKKWSKTNNTSFNILKQKIKKNNKIYEKEIEEFKKNPVDSDEGKKEEEEDEDEKEVKPKEKSKPEKKAFAADDLSDDLDGGQDESEEESEDDHRGAPTSNDPAERRKYWLKKDVDKKKDKGDLSDAEKGSDEDSSEEKTKQKRKPRNPQKERNFDNIGQSSNSTVEILPENIGKKLREIVENRSKRSVNGREYYEILTKILQMLQDDIQRLEVILLLFPIRFDLSRIISANYMPKLLWLESLENLKEMLRIVLAHPKQMGQISTFLKEREGEQYHKEGFIYDTLCTQFEILDNEIFKSFKNTEYSSLEYVEKLNDMSSLLKLGKEIHDLFENLGDVPNAKKIAFTRLEGLYYINDETLAKLAASARAAGKNLAGEFYEEKNSKELIHRLATQVYSNSDEKTTLKALLYHTYHHAIHNRYHQARDLLLMSGISTSVSSYDIGIQALYNRVLVQIGLAAFRIGLINEAHSYLQDICTLQKVRELLSQGVSKISPGDKEERRRLLPYHLHINLELIESVYYISAMLLEIPHFVSDSSENPSKTISKLFRRLFENYDKSHFNGPPESYKDIIYAASKELHKGNWNKCFEYLKALNMWNKVFDAEKTKETLLIRVKESALKCYLFVYRNCYESVQIEVLAKQFEVDVKFIRKIACKLIYSKELLASLDPKNDCILFQNYSVTKLQSLCSNLADKISTVLSRNERILDSKFGSYGFDREKEIQTDAFINKKKQTNKKKNLTNNNNNKKRTFNKPKK